MEASSGGTERESVGTPAHTHVTSPGAIPPDRGEDMERGRITRMPEPSLLERLAEPLADGIDWLAAIFSRVVRPLGRVVEWLAEPLADGIDRLAAHFSRAVQPLGRALEWLAEPLADGVDRLAAFLSLLLRPIKSAVEWLVEPLGDGMDFLGAYLSRAWRLIRRGSFSALMLVPGATAASERLARVLAIRGDGHDLTNDRLKRQYEGLVAACLITSVAVHLGIFILWPSIQTRQLSVASEEIQTLELPPEVKIPPPPRVIQRPAVPVISTDVPVSEDITISPTTFEENPVEALPPPPEQPKTEQDTTPSFTPYTVAPRILNPDEMAALMRSEYPSFLRDAGIGGVVKVWTYISEEGVVTQTQIAESSGYEQLDEAAMRVMRQVRFSPALYMDEKTPVWVVLPLTFVVH